MYKMSIVQKRNTDYGTLDDKVVLTFDNWSALIITADQILSHGEDITISITKEEVKDGMGV